MTLGGRTSCAENGPLVQYSNMQVKLQLQKRILNIAREEKQMKIANNTNQKLATNRLKHCLRKSMYADKEIDKVKRGSEENCSSFGKGSKLAQNLLQSWKKKDNCCQPLEKSRNSEAQAVALPVAIELLQSGGHKIHPDVKKRAEKLQKKHVFHKFALCKVNDEKSCLLPKISLEKHFQRKGDPKGFEADDNDSTFLTTIKPSFASKFDNNEDSELATALWVAQNNLIEVKSADLSAVKPTGAQSKSNASSDIEEKRVTAFTSPPVSPSLSDLRMYDDDSTNSAYENLLMKVNDKKSNINLMDLHRAGVATKNYTTNMRNYVKKIHKYNGERTGDGFDYYSRRISG